MRTLTGSTLYQHLDILNTISPFAFFQWQVDKTCIEWNDSSCAYSWYESVGQGSNRPNRQAWLRCVEDAECQVAEYLGYWPHKNIENEQHKIVDWQETIILDYNKVVAGGKQNLTEVFAGATYSWEAIEKYFPFRDTYRLTISHADISQANTTCNYEDLVFQQDTSFNLTKGWQIRDYEIVSIADGVLVVDFPIILMADHKKYNQPPNKSGQVRKLDLCEDTNFITDFKVFRQTYTEPHGTVCVDRSYCVCGGVDETCGCNLPELEICLIPINPELGQFKVAPIEFDNVDNCYKQIYPNNHFSHNQPRNGYNYLYYPWHEGCKNVPCAMPLLLSVDYLSSCSGDWKEPCKPIKACDKLVRAIVYLALTCMPVPPNCGCVEHLFADFQTTLLLVDSQRKIGRLQNEMLELGSYVGSVRAWEALKLFRDKRSHVSGHLI